MTESNLIIRGIEKLTDNFIAIIVILSSIYFVADGREIPTWFATAFGIVITHFFEKEVRAN